MANEWIQGQPEATQTVYEWVLGSPYILYDNTTVQVVSPDLTDKNNYNGYVAFIQQYIKHKINGSDPWANPQGDLL